MKSRFHNSKKLYIVQRVKSGWIKELCSSYGINQVTYYKWRDKVLKSGDKVFSSKESKEMERLKKQARRLKETVGDLTLELKKATDSKKKKEV